MARPHVERYVSDASAFAARKRQQASQKLHQVVMHDMPAMIETARPHVEQAAFEVQKAAQQKAQEGYEVMQKVVQEDAPKAMAAAQPYVEQAMNTAMYHGSNAMSSAQEAMQIAAEALHQQLFGEEEESSSEDASPEAMEAEQRPMAPMAPMAQAMPTPGSLPRTSDPLPDAAPFRASSLQGSSEAAHLGFARPLPYAHPQMLQSPTAAVAPVPQQVAATSQPPRRFISAASAEDARLMVPGLVRDAVRQNQVQWPARMHSATPRPQQVSWMPPLPRPPGPPGPLPMPMSATAMPAPAQAWSRPG